MASTVPGGSKLGVWRQFFRGCRDMACKSPPPIGLRVLGHFPNARESETLEEVWERHSDACAHIAAMNFYRDVSPLMAKAVGIYQRLRSAPQPRHRPDPSGPYPSDLVGHFPPTGHICKNVPSPEDSLRGVQTAYEGLIEDFYSSEDQEFTMENCTKAVYENLSARTPDFATRDVRIDQTEVVLDEVSGPYVFKMMEAAKKGQNPWEDGELKDNLDPKEMVEGTTPLNVKAYCVADLTLSPGTPEETRLIRADEITLTADFSMLDGITSEFRVSRWLEKGERDPDPEQDAYLLAVDSGTPLDEAEQAHTNSNNR